MPGSNALTSRGLILFLSLSTSCLGREFWNGTKEGMSMPQLMKLFGAQLKPYSVMGSVREGMYTLSDLQPLCGGNFQVVFGFDTPKPNAAWFGKCLNLTKQQMQTVGSAIAC